MPAYNAERYICQAIDSVLSQTYKNFELIIVNDCSTDNTQKIIEKMRNKDNRIKIYKNEKNCGVSFTRNFAVSKAKGEWVAFLDSDDMWTQNKLEEQMKFIDEQPDEPIIVYTASSFINENDEKYKYQSNVPYKVDYKNLLKQNVISCSSVLIQKKCFNEISWENDRVHEDFLLWLKVLKKYDIYAYGINKPLLIYRISNNSRSGNKIKATRMTYNVYKCMELKYLERLYYMSNYIIKSLKKYKNIKNEE